MREGGAGWGWGTEAAAGARRRGGLVRRPTEVALGLWDWDGERTAQTPAGLQEAPEELSAPSTRRPLYR